MSSTLITALSILGFIAAMSLLVVAVLFLYVAKQLWAMLDWMHRFSKTYLGLDIPEERAGKGTFEGHVKMQAPWDEEKDGRD